VVFRPDGALMPTEDQSLLEDLVRRGLLATVPSKVRTSLLHVTGHASLDSCGLCVGGVGSSGQGLCA
jgi:hypothetical protein